MPDIIPFDSTPAGKAEVPAYIASAFTDSNIPTRSTIDQLSFKGKTWTRVVAGEATPLMKVDENGDQVPVPVVSLVVLDMGKHRSRAYYAGGFEDGANKRPDCYSKDGIKPDEGVKEPQCATCAQCPQAVKGSKTTDNGKATTACGQFKRIVVIPSASSIIKDHPPMLLRIAQTSMWDKDNAENESKGWYAWDQYLDMLRARNVMHTGTVETRVKFDARVAYPKLLFSASRWLSPDETAIVKQRLESDAETIAKIINGGDNDGLMGQPTNGASDTPSMDAAQAAEAAAAASQPAKAPPKPKAPPKAAPAPAAAPKIVKTMTAKADGFTLQQMLDAGWTEEDLVAEGMLVITEEAAAPAKPKSPPKPKAPPKAAPAPAAAPEGDTGGESDAFAGVSPAPAATQAEAPPPAAQVVEGTPAGLSDLLNNWDD
jgi:pyruvate/2-oxoglutarate dehydrogenase complex dihydrolipoamide acyltransferase (E2) component